MFGLRLSDKSDCELAERDSSAKKLTVSSAFRDRLSRIDPVAGRRALAHFDDAMKKREDTHR